MKNFYVFMLIPIKYRKNYVKIFADRETIRAILQGLGSMEELHEATKSPKKLSTHEKAESIQRKSLYEIVSIETLACVIRNTCIYINGKLIGMYRQM
ncbi:hypothetical protein KTT_45620 [Tengunoibacter tsumagoiensis]|uniref:Uncharacterized protein n=1 Tax=Tengunoibacter tsumagoiensis TaxID=2014871 RepID=A0A402A6D4_9CHLR|nr:hypothetical protein KTT_45620 [Tengunoibacter tsumagoiensis]